MQRDPAHGRRYESGAAASRWPKWSTLSGVAFWDFKHGQTGVAPNAIELHPILGFACLSGVGRPLALIARGALYENRSRAALLL